MTTETVSKAHVRNVLNRRIFAVQNSAVIIQKDAILRELHFVKDELLGK